MSFTDNQVILLKEELAERTSMGDEIGDGYLNPDEIKALLARLEAAERCLSSDPFTSASDFEAWRKAAGK